MGRQFRDKIHVGQRKQRQKNGDIYILERTTKYDPETKKTLTIAQKLLGKIPAGQTEMIPTRPKRPDGEKASLTTRKHTGLTDILSHIGKASGIDTHVCEAFPDGGTAEKILSIVRYWVGTGGQTLPRMATWQAMHDLPYPYVMSDDVIGDLFKTIGHDEQGIQDYFRLRASRLDDNAVIAYDSTTQSTYSENLHEARQGFNKDGDGLNTIKLLTLYSVKDREPIAFAKQPGNIPDVISVSNAITQLESLGVPRPLVVTDNGYYSQANMAEFAIRNQKFLTLVDTDVSWVREVIDSLEDELDGADGVCPFDNAICGATLTREKHKLSRIRKRTRGEKRVGDEEVFERRIYVHVFRSPDMRAKKEIHFNTRLATLKDQLESGMELSDSAERWAAKYMTVSRQGRGGKAKVTFKSDAIRKARKYLGYFALVSNQAMDTFEALRNYRLRERIEENFGIDKRYLDGRRPRLWTADALRGRQFVQFVGLGYLSWFMKRIDEIEECLGKETDGKNKEEIKLEKNLKSWLKTKSKVDIFDWFDCVETTVVTTEAGKFRWSTESIKRDKLFLTLLGMSGMK